MGVKDPILPSVWVNSCLIVKCSSHSQATFFFPSGLGMRLAACYNVHVSCYIAANNASFLKLSRDTESDPCWGWFWVWDRDYHSSQTRCVCHEMKYTHAPAQ